MHNTKPPAALSKTVEWDCIDTVFLDMDGTLLDKYFDDFFWEHHVPAVFAEKNNLDERQSRKELLARYKRVENSLQWTDLHFWSRQLELDIPQLKQDVGHMVAELDHTAAFLKYLKSTGKHLCLITNAHPIGLEIKLSKTQIAPYFHQIITSDSVGEAKENVAFWHKLEKHIDFDKRTTFFADDTEKVLQAADRYGIKHLVHIAHASSRKRPEYSRHFHSIADFRDIIPDVYYQLKLHAR